MYLQLLQQAMQNTTYHMMHFTHNYIILPISTKLWVLPVLLQIQQPTYEAIRIPVVYVQKLKKCWIYAKYIRQNDGEGSTIKLAPCREHHFVVPLEVYTLRPNSSNFPGLIPFVFRMPVPVVIHFTYMLQTIFENKCFSVLIPFHIFLSSSESLLTFCLAGQVIFLAVTLHWYYKIILTKHKPEAM